MGAAAHLGIDLRDYDDRIRTFIPHYEEMLDAAASALSVLGRRRPVLIDLGVGSGALAARCLRTLPSAKVIGIDSDEGMLTLARKRLGRRLTTVVGDFVTTPLAPADAITASFALHHIPTPRQKKALYRRCFRALSAGGVLINADCCLNANPRLQTRDRAAWHAHLTRRYGAATARRYLRTWGKEDVYFTLADEIDLMRAAGFAVDVPWRRDSFAVVVGVRRGGRGR